LEKLACAGQHYAAAGHFKEASDPSEIGPSLVHQLERWQIRTLLEFAESAGVRLHSSQQPDLTLAAVLDAFDDEFQLARLLSDPVAVFFHGHRRTACPAPDEPERCLALVCAAALLHADNSKTRGRITALLQQ
jgi:hypothetical protein